MISTMEIPIPAEDDPFWGGEHFDGHRPVRAHVLAALWVVPEPYPPPVDALRRLGDVRTIHPEVGRITGAITQEHVPALIRMARDRHLFAAPGDSPDVWAPLHALYRLAELDLSEHLAELIPLCDLESDWLSDSLLPELFAELGPPMVPHLTPYLLDHNRWGWGHYTAARALQQIAAEDPATRAVAVATFCEMLDSLDFYSATSCMAAVDMLVELRAIEALPQLRSAFAAGKVDELLRGDWGSVLDELGVAPDPDDPLLAESSARREAARNRFAPPGLRSWLASLGQSGPLLPHVTPPRQAAPPPKAPERPAPPPRQSVPRSVAPERPPQPSAQAAEQRARKAKQKRKQQEASRKANRKKR